MANINDELANLAEWAPRVCDVCGRGPTEARLNIEAVVHHNAVKLRCVDRRPCERTARRRRDRPDDE